jgi:hypothetical protein
MEQYFYCTYAFMTWTGKASTLTSVCNSSQFGSEGKQKND